MGFRILEETDDLLELRLRLVHARYVGKSDLGVGLHVDLRLALADRQQSRGTAFATERTAHHKEPDGDEDKRRHRPGEQIAQNARLDHPCVLNLVLGQISRQLRIDAHRNELRGLARLREPVLACDVIGVDFDFRDLAFGERVLKIAVADFLNALAGDPKVANPKNREQGEERIREVEQRPSDPFTQHPLASRRGYPKKYVVRSGCCASDAVTRSSIYSIRWARWSRQ